MIFPVILSLALIGLFAPPAFAQFQQGGVDYPGEWYAGEGLKQGDFFSYSLCFKQVFFPELTSQRQCCNKHFDC